MIAEIPPGIPEKSRESFQRFLAFPMDTRQRMEDALDRWLANLIRYEGLDAELAGSLVTRLKKLLALENAPELHRQWVQAAARYFFLSEDGDHDWAAENGLHDDEQVVRAVEAAVL